MHHFLKSHGLAPEDIDWFISGKNGQEATDAVYTELEHSLFLHALHSSFKAVSYTHLDVYKRQTAGSTDRPDHHQGPLQ